MYKVYLKQAWALMGQNRFFTAVYIIGTGLAISMVMAIAVVYHIRTANIAPEVPKYWAVLLYFLEESPTEKHQFVLYKLQWLHKIRHSLQSPYK